MTGRPPFPLPRTVALVGLMGAGKSSIGRRLAQRLKVPFVDADSEIEAAAGATIEEIFERHGEAAFREGERRVIARLLDGPTQVLATGGGAFMDPGDSPLMRERAITIWLRADLDLLLGRVVRRSNRPLLKNRRSARRPRAPDGRAPSRLCRGRPHRRHARRAARGDARAWSSKRSRPISASRRCRHERRERLRVALGARSYDIVVGSGLLEEAGALMRPVLRQSRGRRRHRRDRGGAASRRASRPGSRRPASRIRRSFCRRASRPRISRHFQKLAEDILGARHRAPHHARRVGRRRRRRSHRLCRRDPAARHRLCADPDDAAGAGRQLGRRQDRDRHDPRQEPGRRLPSAGAGAGRYRRRSRPCRGANCWRAMPRS